MTIFHQSIFAWWRTNGRVLPWREKLSHPANHLSHPGNGKSKKNANPKNAGALALRDYQFQTYFASSLRRDPYRVVVAEMMLQQTQVDRVLPKYEAWMRKWPKIEDLAQAQLPEVLIFWQGLGYNRRARFLWLLAQEIAVQRQGVWPTTEEELRELAGIGKYTARAIQTFAFGQHVGVVDTNVRRVLGRWLDKENLKDAEFFVLADEVLPKDQADPWNQALMDFGALVCTAKNPKCGECPVAHVCKVNLKAQSNGYATYADFLKDFLKALSIDQPGARKKSKSMLPFKDTDRFFRGRILDELRARPCSLNDLEKILRENHGLHDSARFQKLLSALEKEGLLQVKNNMVSLG